MATPSQRSCMSVSSKNRQCAHPARVRQRLNAGAAMSRTLICCCLLIASAMSATAQNSAPGPWRPLLDAKLSNFDVYLSYHGNDILNVIQGKAPKGLKPIGLNPKSQNVFSVIEQDGKPVLHITGEIYGCLQTREPFSNYHLKLETR